MTKDAASAAGSGEAIKTKVFLSYARKDMGFADRLEAALKSRNFEPLIDRTEIYAFEDWWKRIQALIAEADTVIFIISPDSVGSKVCGQEVAYAAALNKRFAPVVLRRVADADIPEALAKLNFIFFDEDTAFDTGIARLRDALQTDIGWIRQHTAFGEQARRWAGAGRPGGLLLRSPLLEEAEHWIAMRPQTAPLPTQETQSFIAASRRGASRRRNILTGSLTAGLLIALALAGLAFWQRSVAVEQQKIAEEQRQIADRQRKRAEDTLAAATRTANGLVFTLAQKFRDQTGVPASLVKDILDRARALQDQLIKSGETTPDLKRSEAAALVETVISLLAIGDAKGALAAAEEAKRLDEELLAANPDNPNYQLIVSITDEKIGDVQAALGHLPEALAAYQASLAIRQKLTKDDPGIAAWQRDLAVSYQKLGNVQAAQGALTEAFKSYQASLAISERLVKTDGSNKEWQRDIAVCQNKIGDVEMSRHHAAEALAAYQASLIIIARLAASDSGNTTWQRDLSATNDRIGDAQMGLAHVPEALKAYQASLAVVERLSRSDPGNTEWQRDVVVACVKIAMADPTQARAYLLRAQAIVQQMQKSGQLAPRDSWMPAELAKLIAALPK